jgi:PQQ-dependent dehydrogenase (s-GDH family)
VKWFRTAVVALCCTTLALAGAAPPATAQGTGSPDESFSSRVLATGLDNPWELTSGPDGFLWVTEKTAGRVTRVRPSDGAKRTAVTIPDLLVTEGAQDGLLGMALHPALLRSSTDQYVYVAYTYDADPGAEVTDGRIKIRRYTYERRSRRLTRPYDLITGLPANTDHNAGRLVFGPDHKLYYSVGDQGHNQFDYYCLPIHAQELPTATQVRANDWSAYQGKILRLNLDGSIPTDNPVFGGVRSHVYTYGHRNPQGLVFGPRGILYSSEHGPKTDDEINIIHKGRNYGWPQILGYQDDSAYVYANWSASRGVPCQRLTYSDYVIPPSVPTQTETSFRDPAFTPPITTLYTVPSDYKFRDPRCTAQRDFICWPTIAPASIDIYTARWGIPGWANSLLLPSLKHGTVYRVKLSADGRAVRGHPMGLWTTVNRYRDIAIDPDQRTFYVATDKAGLTRDRAGRPTTKLENPGSILVFCYTRSA